MMRLDQEPDQRTHWDSEEDQDEDDAKAGFFLDEEAHGPIQDREED
jgi:hypothetical protein